MFGNSSKPKNKASATFLAIFFGFAAWFYTYREDKKKFWFASTLSLVLIIFFLIVMISIFSDFSNWVSAISNLDSDTGDFVQIPKAKWLALAGITLVSFGLWLWPIIVTIKRPPTWYEEYDKKSQSPAS